MRNHVVLDGLHFPHVLDAVIEYSTPESLVSISQVCQQWRIRVKDAFHQVQAFMEDGHYDQSFRLKSGRTYTSRELLDNPKARALLILCQVFDTVPTKTPFQCRTMGLSTPQIFSNVKLFRTPTSANDGLRVVHINSPSTPVQGCSCSLWLFWPDISRVVFTTRAVGYNLNESSEVYGRVPRSAERIVFIFLPEIMPAKRNGWPEDHMYTFCDIIAAAWKGKRSVTVVNASSLDGLQEWLNETDGNSAEEKLRLRAIRTVLDFVPPGPVCPVHFVTLEEYRRQVGELEYTINTDSGWSPRTA